MISGAAEHDSFWGGAHCELPDILRLGLSYIYIKNADVIYAYYVLITINYLGGSLHEMALTADPSDPSFYALRVGSYGL